MPTHALTVAPYGSWRSPITPSLLVAGTIRLASIELEGGDTYWIEARPAEGGRSALVKRSAAGTIADVIPPPFDARTRVHEYGGGAYLVDAGVVYFSNFSDQRLYRVRPGAEPEPVTAPGAHRYADGIVDRRRRRILCVREDHSGGGEPVNALVAIDLAGEASSGRVLAGGHDFCSSPRLSPDGSRLAWLTWDHPDMPWDGTTLWTAAVAGGGSLDVPQKMAGGREESIFQPEWSPAGNLYFVSDRSGYWNLYRMSARGGTAEAVYPIAADCGLPQWGFGMATYGFAGDGRILLAVTQEGVWRLLLVDPANGRAAPIVLPWTDISPSAGLRVDGMRAVFAAGSPAAAEALIELDLATGTSQVLRRSSDLVIDPDTLSVPEAVTYPTTGGATAHAFYYRPRNRDFVAPTTERPPLLVLSHGGPTSAAGPSLRPAIQYWTSRGFAVLDVNYGGSTGYGRAYRERLNGQWGIVDVDDCANGARWLVARGEADGERLAIRGGSAGGYTTLCALTFRDVFRAGASHYGVSDLEALARDTHKFESRYLDRLVGPYPERQSIYVERSPIHSTDRLSCPVIFFQGLADPVVPPDQAKRMVAALRRKGLPVAYVAFPGEMHGFRQAENIKRAFDAELYFYSRVFGFALADPVEPVAIENLPG